MKNILFYITGHGFGHATRSIEIIKKLVTNSAIHCHVKTNAPEWLFKLNLPRSVRHNYLFIDIGVAHHDWLTVDKKTTLAAAHEMWLDKKMLVERELKYIRGHGIDLIVADIPAMAFEIADAAGIPGVAISNFSWDWIYQPYADEFREYEHVPQLLRQAYQKATRLLRLPFYGQMDAFQNVVDVPLIGREASLDRDIIRQKLLISDTHKPLALISLHTADLKRLDFEKISQIENIHFLLTGKKEYQSDNITYLPTDLIPFQEIVNAVDVVISKPGYGIVSECIVNQTPLMYTFRKDFQEFYPLQQGLEKYAMTEFVPLPEFLAGDWNTPLQGLLEREPNWPQINKNGVDVVVEQLSSFLN